MKLARFRFTSPDKAAIEAVAAQYGGTVEPWHDDKAAPKDQWQVETPARSIEVWLPPGSLTVDYEKWGGKGRERVCDGIRLELEVEKGRGNWETVEQDCLCNKRNVKECVPVTRISVILPGVTFGGVWRLESKGWNAAEELPAIADAIDEMQADGILLARLSADERNSRGGSRQYVVPALELVATPQQMLGGAGRVTPALAAAPEAPAIAAPWDPDEEVADAEIVEDDEVQMGLEALAREALDFDEESPMVDEHTLLAGLAESNPVEEIERKLRGVIAGQARIIRDADGWKVVRR